MAATFNELECKAFTMADRFAKQHDWTLFDELKSMPSANAATISAMMHYRICNMYMQHHHDFMNGLVSRIDIDNKAQH